MTQTRPAPLSLRLGPVLRRLCPDPSRLRVSLRNMAFAALLTLPAGVMLHAEGTQPDWMPAALTMPDDMDVMNNRAIGESLRMFSFSTDADPDELLVTWEESLREAGYTIDMAQDDVLNKMIEFSGQGINNAKIVIAPLEDSGRAVIEFDATLQ